MDRARGQAVDDATAAEHDAPDGTVVCQHGKHGIAAGQAFDTLAAALAPCATSVSTFESVRL